MEPGNTRSHNSLLPACMCTLASHTGSLPGADARFAGRFTRGMAGTNAPGGNLQIALSGHHDQAHLPFRHFTGPNPRFRLDVPAVHFVGNAAFRYHLAGNQPPPDAPKNRSHALVHVSGSAGFRKKSAHDTCNPHFAVSSDALRALGNCRLDRQFLRQRPPFILMLGVNPRMIHVFTQG
jgi:hypothetical protein